MDGQGNFKRTWKVRKKSGNMKINGYGSLQKGYTFSLGTILSSLGPWGANSFTLRVTSNFEVIQLAPLW